MNEKSFQQLISIQKPLKVVSEFIKDIHNLPKWTKFFVKIKGPQPPFYAVETIIGPALTQVISVNGNKLFEIISQFANRIEKAKIQLNQNKFETQLTFTIFFPKNSSQEIQIQLIDNLQSELNTLKLILERQNT
jgi:hypothetical protein